MATITPKTTSSSPRRPVIPAVTGPPDRLAYLWLALAIVLLPFGTVRWTVPLAAWLYPVFLLRFVRTQPLWRGILLVFLAIMLVLVFVLQGVFPIPGTLYYLCVFIISVPFTLPYLIDRVLAPRIGGLLGTLVFPLAVTSVWYLNALLNPLSGTQVNPAYTQYGDLPLLQLLSVTGLWGILFVMSWLASLVNWAWECGFAWPRVRRGAALYASLLALVLLCGGARLAFSPPQANTVRIAGISPSQAAIAAAEKQLSQFTLSGTATSDARAHSRQMFAQAVAPLTDELFARSEQEARAGAKIITWSEGATGVFQEDEAALIARASTLARTMGVYLDMGVGVVLQHPVQSRSSLDENILIDPSGRVVWRYEKAHPVVGAEANVVPGDGQVPTVQTPYGRLSGVVCFDADFPDTLRQAGQAGADIMLVPSNDNQAMDPVHTQGTTFRAIENGYSLVRQTSNGLAMTVDYEGHVLSASDFFTSDQEVMVAYVPIQGVRTIYATIGDLFAWLSVAGLVVLIGIALARRRTATAGEVGVAEPISAQPSSGEPPATLPEPPRRTR